MALVYFYSVPYSNFLYKIQKNFIPYKTHGGEE